MSSSFKRRRGGGGGLRGRIFWSSAKTVVFILRTVAFCLFVCCCFLLLLFFVLIFLFPPVSCCCCFLFSSCLCQETEIQKPARHLLLITFLLITFRYLVSGVSGPLWVHVRAVMDHARADMGSRERAFMSLESRAISARVTKLIVTIYSKTCNNVVLWHYNNWLSLLGVTTFQCL